MAQAVKEVFPTAQITIAPALEDSFFYDFAFERPFTPEDLEKIEARVREIIKRNLPVTRRELSKQEAIQFFQSRGEAYKVELIQGFPEHEPISAYSQGEFVDLCRGPHLPATGHVGAFKLLTTAGAYWRGDERNPMLQRIYGTSFPTQAELDAYLARLGIVRVLLDDLTGFDYVQDFFDVNAAERLFFHLLSSMVGESAIGRTSPNLSVVHRAAALLQAETGFSALTGPFGPSL